MTDPLLDEDGRCRRTDLLPGECGCAGHRGGEVIELDREPRKRVDFSAHVLDELEVKSLRQAQYSGWCSLDPSHEILLRHDIGFVVSEDGVGLGWACAQCVSEILMSGDAEKG